MIAHPAGACSRHPIHPRLIPAPQPAADRSGGILALLPLAELRRLVAAMVD